MVIKYFLGRKLCLLGCVFVTATLEIRAPPPIGHTRSVLPYYLVKIVTKDILVQLCSYLLTVPLKSNSYYRADHICFILLLSVLTTLPMLGFFEHSSDLNSHQGSSYHCPWLAVAHSNNSSCHLHLFSITALGI